MSTFRFPNPRWACLCLATALIPLAAGCDSGSPAAPSTPAASVPGASTNPAPTSAAASLIVDSFEIEPWPGAVNSAGSYSYLPTVVLREVGGKSAAHLRSLTFSLPNRATEVIDTGCLPTTQSRVVPAGQNWDTSEVYLYCLGLECSTNLAGASVKVVVAYTDDQGVSGQVESTVTVEN